MAKGEELEESAFVSRGQDPWPPLDPDTQDVRNFSDEKKWPTPKLVGRLGRYTKFLDWEDPMQRARDKAHRIIGHILFELPYRGIVLTIDLGDDEDDWPTQELDTQALKDMLEEES